MVVEPRQTLLVLANVLLEAQGDTLRMTATDLEVSVRVTGPARDGLPTRASGHASALSPPPSRPSARRVGTRPSAETSSGTRP